jgi:AAA+ superfamily predicted ATPase
MPSTDDLFHLPLELPEPVREARYKRLVGLDAIKDRLRLEAELLVDPERLKQWSKAHHDGRELAALTLFADRGPLFVFAGDVGSGKTALAESFGCDLADHLDMPVGLYRLKLLTRGSGLVGEMTSLISDAFTRLLDEGRRAVQGGRPRKVLVMVIDEADALAQSRAASQMHHEDRAGVDALLEGIDGLAGEGVPVIVVLCTNRAKALDPAVIRRAAEVFTFQRPTDEQRRHVLTSALDGASVSAAEIGQVVTATGPRQGLPGYTFSDLTQRLVPAAVLAAYQSKQPLTGKALLEAATRTQPSPEFVEDSQ